jgi:hypothetical protein
MRGDLRNLRARLRRDGRHGSLCRCLPLLRAILPGNGLGIESRSAMDTVQASPAASLQTRWCIAGGGPAGMMLG